MATTQNEIKRSIQKMSRRANVNEVPLPSAKQIEHFRRQYPVGHGFFHAGQLIVGPVEFNYVFDCGAKKRKKVKREVAEWSKRFRGERRLNLLAVSHLHADHANGCDTLLLGASVDAVVLPYLSPIERILLVAEAVSTRTLSGSELDQMIDPVSWFMNRGANRIYLITRNGEPPEDALEEGTKPDLPQKGWAFGREPGLTREAGLVHLDHTTRLVASMRGAAWEFSFYVSPPPRELEVFQEALMANFRNDGRGPQNLPVFAPEKALRDWIITALRSDKGQGNLRRSYAAVASNINWTSLSLYTAPAAPYRAVNGRRGANRGREMPNIGWLGTGDSVLKSRENCVELLRHFFEVRDVDVGTLALPHHGSRHNFNELLVERTDPDIIFVTSDAQQKKEVHPHPKVEKAVRALGHRLHRVTEEDESTITEMYSVAFTNAQTPFKTSATRESLSH